METIILIVLSILNLGLIILAFFFWRVIARLRDEVTNMRYIKVLKNEDGSFTLTTRDGNTIFEL